MATITRFAADGGARTRDVADGDSLMAVMAAVPGIDGDCGGTCAGATGRVHDPAWRPAASAASAMETAMLDFAAGVAADSWRTAPDHRVADARRDGRADAGEPAMMLCCHPRESGDRSPADGGRWVPAFAGMTGKNA